MGQLTRALASPLGVTTFLAMVLVTSARLRFSFFTFFSFFNPNCLEAAAADKGLVVDTAAGGLYAATAAGGLVAATAATGLDAANATAGFVAATAEGLLPEVAGTEKLLPRLK
jgi:hypothetical protein